VPLKNISLKNFRCFDNLKITLSPRINFFCGANGSGKTSILEAIFIFSSGKSFKSSNLASLIQHNNESFLLEGFDGNKGYVVEIKKNKKKPISILLNNSKTVTNKLIKEFPCTPIHNNTFSFADASPDFRRKLLDRSIFIAEEEFSKTWFSYHRALKQRNAMLKSNRISDIYIWNDKISEDGEKLSKFRKSFFDKTLFEFKKILKITESSKVFDFFDFISIDFFRGWPTSESLSDNLKKNEQLDIKRRLTTNGPHKSDIRFSINETDARQILSRGEQKFFSILWSCAQHEVLKKHYAIEASLIIDDIRSELDERVFELFINLLKHIENQVIFSCIEDCFSSKMLCDFKEFKKFHMEQLR
tara:strand:+ start:12758 stop:13834 length:1077 start_codon:yes stop_codon:yes gene_type:complete